MNQISNEVNIIKKLLELTIEMGFEPLLPVAALRNLLPVAEFLPPAIGKEIILESCLKKSQQVDLSVQIQPKVSPDGGVLVPLSSPLINYSEWQRLEKFAASFAFGCGGGIYSTPSIGLEFDAESLGDQDFPCPNVFFNLLPQGEKLWFDRSPNYYQALNQALEILTGEPFSQSIFNRLCLCLNSLPNKGAIFLLALMLNRASSGVRLCLTNLDSNDRTQYLQDCGWKGLLPEQILPSEIVNYKGATVLHLDVGATLGSKFGLEFYPVQSDPKNDIAWQRLLKSLKIMGRADSDLLECLQDWSGREIVAIDTNSSPFLVERVISHIKLTCTAVGEVKAKAYVTLFPRSLSQLDIPTNRLIDRFVTEASKQSLLP